MYHLSGEHVFVYLDEHASILTRLVASTTCSSEMVSTCVAFVGLLSAYFVLAMLAWWVSKHIVVVVFMTGASSI